MLLLWQRPPGSTNKKVSEFFYWTLVWNIHCTHVMQLFLHILKMMQILHFFHTWLRVASSLDIIHQDRTGEASAGKLKFWEGEEFAERFAAEPDGSIAKSRRLLVKVEGLMTGMRRTLCFMVHEVCDRHPTKSKNWFKGKLWVRSCKRNSIRSKSESWCWIFDVGQLWVIFSKRRNVLRLDFWMAWHVVFTLHRSMYWILIFMLPMTRFFQSLFSMCQGSTLIPSWGVSSYTNVPTMIYELLYTRYRVYPVESYCIYKKEMWNLLYFESGFFFGEKDAFQLFPGI